ncbi:MAG: Holliday junction branch migration protein RuvA [Acutalibacteraceae bacterium]|nr:Holliday junction branch migration protein RuvA [Acutalibacteraceae bacterium]
MIASLRGQLIYSDTQSVIIECGGVGMRCFTSLKTIAALPKINNDVFLHTYLSVREDALDLYGFISEEELRTFKLITSVNGVGSKIGIAILSEFTPEQVALIIASADSKTLSKANGVGAKLANRIILELKDKVDASGGSVPVSAVAQAAEHTNSRDAIDALISLGFTRSEASLAVGKFNPEESTEVLIREALKILAK